MRDKTLSFDENINHLRNFVSQRLNKKEKIILKEIAKNNFKFSATKFVSLICENYGFSKTCVWYNLRKLRNSGFLDFGNSSKKLCLTKLGELLGGELNEQR